MNTGLVWQKLPDSATRTWLEASEYCKRLVLDGGGWHLPSLKELLTIVDPTRYQPSVNPAFFPFTKNARYWTSTEFLDGRNSAYQVELERGSGSAIATTSFTTSAASAEAAKRPRSYLQG